MVATEAISRFRPNEEETALSTVDSFQLYEALDQPAADDDPVWCLPGAAQRMCFCVEHGCFEVDRIEWSWERYSVSAKRKIFHTARGGRADEGDDSKKDDTSACGFPLHLVP